MRLKVDEIDKWEDVVSSVEKDHIPIDCVKKIIFKLKGKKQKTINLDTLRRNGLEADDIETVVSRTMSEFGKNITNIDFVIDVNAVAGHVQPITDRILKQL